MKVARLYSIDDIRIEETQVPEIGSGDALVRVRACGICSGDIMPWYISRKAPLVLGHEPAGEIVSAGEEVTNFKAGDRIFFHHHAPCHECRYCQRGDHVQCETWRSSCIIPGGIAEYALIPRVNLQGDTLRLPENITFAEATLVEPVACVVKGFRRAAIRSGDTVLVMGLGVMGQLHVLLAKTYGAGKVIGADSVQYRIDKALSFGADSVINISNADLAAAMKEETGGEMADVTVVGPGDIHAMHQGIRCTGRGGRVLFFTPSQPEDVLQIRPNEIYFRDTSIITSYSCGPDDTREALRLIAAGNVEADSLITHTFPLENTADAYRLTAKARESLKVVVAL